MNSRDTIWFVLALVLVTSMTLWYVGGRKLVERYSQHQQVQQQTQAAKEQSQRLEKEIGSTRERIEHLGSDPMEIEAAIRRSKELVREGEKIYRIEKAPK
ncbi:MAG: septum formation initiator family protein [Candidatus Hydrogenedentes bacterium]|nr:septum formation initiator family protein [Candidatus Hydrogenedentota bacterium]